MLACGKLPDLPASAFPCWPIPCTSTAGTCPVTVHLSSSIRHPPLSAPAFARQAGARQRCRRAGPPTTQSNAHLQRGGRPRGLPAPWQRPSSSGACRLTTATHGSRYHRSHPLGLPLTTAQPTGCRGSGTPYAAPYSAGPSGGLRDLPGRHATILGRSTLLPLRHCPSSWGLVIRTGHLPGSLVPQVRTTLLGPLCSRALH